MSSEIWKIERDLCRGCHAEGIFINLAEPRGRNDQKEIYSDMLKDCLDINIYPVPGILCEVTYTICEACILRLRDAFDFKRQVQACEEKFKDLYNKNCIKVANDNCHDLLVKVEVPDSLSVRNENCDDLLVKVEAPDSLPDFKYAYSNDEDDDHLMDFDSEEHIKNNTNLKDRTKKAKDKGKTKAKAKTKKLVQRKEKQSVNEKKAEDVEETSEQLRKKGSATQEAARNFTLTEDEDGTVNFSCNTCMKSFKRRELYMQHYIHVHLKLRPKLRTCNVCHMKIPPQLRAEHFEKMHGVPPPTCAACGKKFAFPNQVIRHQKVDHMGEMRYECNYCGKKFATRNYLSKHEVKHLPFKEFPCIYCNKAFKWKKNLKTHMRIHLNERPYVCTICQEAFVQSSSLKYHMSRRHTDLEY